MHDGMPYGWNQGQGHSREVDRQSPTGLIFKSRHKILFVPQSFYWIVNRPATSASAVMTIWHYRNLIIIIIIIIIAVVLL